MPSSTRCPQGNLSSVNYQPNRAVGEQKLASDNEKKTKLNDFLGVSQSSWGFWKGNASSSMEEEELTLQQLIDKAINAVDGSTRSSANSSNACGGYEGHISINNPYDYASKKLAAYRMLDIVVRALHDKENLGRAHRAVKFADGVEEAFNCNLADSYLQSCCGQYPEIYQLGQALIAGEDREGILKGFFTQDNIINTNELLTKLIKNDENNEQRNSLTKAIMYEIATQIELCKKQMQVALRQSAKNSPKVQIDEVKTQVDDMILLCTLGDYEMDIKRGVSFAIVQIRDQSRSKTSDTKDIKIQKMIANYMLSTQSSTFDQLATEFGITNHPNKDKLRIKLDEMRETIRVWVGSNPDTANALISALEADARRARQLSMGHGKLARDSSSTGSRNLRVLSERQLGVDPSTTKQPEPRGISSAVKEAGETHHSAVQEIFASSPTPTSQLVRSVTPSPKEGNANLGSGIVNGVMGNLIRGVVQGFEGTDTAQLGGRMFKMGTFPRWPHRYLGSVASQILPSLLLSTPLNSRVDSDNKPGRLKVAVRQIDYNKGTTSASSIMPREPLEGALTPTQEVSSTNVIKDKLNGLEVAVSQIDSNNNKEDTSASFASSPTPTSQLVENGNITEKKEQFGADSTVKQDSIHEVVSSYIKYSSTVDVPSSDNEYYDCDSDSDSFGDEGEEYLDCEPETLEPQNSMTSIEHSVSNTNKGDTSSSFASSTTPTDKLVRSVPPPQEISGTNVVKITSATTGSQPENTVKLNTENVREKIDEYKNIYLNLLKKNLIGWEGARGFILPPERALMNKKPTEVIQNDIDKVLSIFLKSIQSLDNVRESETDQAKGIIESFEIIKPAINILNQYCIVNPSRMREIDTFYTWFIEYLLGEVGVILPSPKDQQQCLDDIVKSTQNNPILLNNTLRHGSYTLLNNILTRLIYHRLTRLTYHITDVNEFRSIVAESEELFNTIPAPTTPKLLTQWNNLKYKFELINNNHILTRLTHNITDANEFRSIVKESEELFNTIKALTSPQLHVSWDNLKNKFELINNNLKPSTSVTPGVDEARSSIRTRFISEYFDTVIGNIIAFHGTALKTENVTFNRVNVDVNKMDKDAKGQCENLSLYLDKNGLFYQLVGENWVKLNVRPEKAAAAQELVDKSQYTQEKLAEIFDNVTDVYTIAINLLNACKEILEVYNDGGIWKNPIKFGKAMYNIINYGPVLFKILASSTRSDEREYLSLCMLQIIYSALDFNSEFNLSRLLRMDSNVFKGLDRNWGTIPIFSLISARDDYPDGFPGLVKNEGLLQEININPDGEGLNKLRYVLDEYLLYSSPPAAHQPNTEYPNIKEQQERFRNDILKLWQHGEYSRAMFCAVAPLTYEDFKKLKET
ncbi:MAG: hypothetical protein KBD37_07600 [Burkholderiales bacterium]|nr:hypothetical protein [Burkholderiales bacterium]